MKFQITFMAADKDSLSIYQNYTGVLIGFKKRYMLFTDWPAMRHKLKPGIYETLGDPVIRLENSRVITLPMLHLSPMEAETKKLLMQNHWYREEARQVKFIKDVPACSYELYDKVLACPMDPVEEDIVGLIADIKLIDGEIWFSIQTTTRRVFLPHYKVIHTLDNDESDNTRDYIEFIEHQLERDFLTGTVVGTDLRYMDRENTVRYALREDS